MSYSNVTVFGGGNAAFAVAACLSLKGLNVTLCDFPEFRQAIEPIAAADNIIDLVRDEGPFEGKARVRSVTTDVPGAIRDAELIVVCTQAYAHRRLAREAAAHLRDGQHVLLLPGSSFGAAEFRHELRRNGCKARIVLAEANTLVFATRKTDVPNQSRIKLWATEVFIAALPAADTDKILAPFKEIFPQCVAATDTLETCLLNLNPYVHSAAAVLSISAVERANNNFRHYVDGITPSTAKVMQDLDNERVEVCRRLGYIDWDVAKIFYRAGYLSQLTGDWVADMQSRPVLQTAKGPFNIGYRYYTEDTGVGLTAVHSIGKQLGIQMPTHFALVHLTGVMAGTDFFGKCTRTLERMEITETSAEKLRQRFVGA